MVSGGVFTVGERQTGSKGERWYMAVRLTLSNKDGKKQASTAVLQLKDCTVFKVIRCP